MATLRQAITEAQSNPNSPFAIELRKRIENGELNDRMRQEGIKIPKYIEKKESFKIAAEDTGATFPAEPGEGPISAGLKAVGNVPSSAVNFAKNIGKAVLNPIDTARGLINVAKGGVQTAGEATGRALGLRNDTEDVVDTKAEQSFDTFVNAMKERYGSLENLQRTATNDPFGFGSDVLGLITGAAGALGKTGTVTKGLENISTATRNITSKVLRPITSKVDDVAIRQMDKALNLNPSDIRRIEKPNIANQSPSKWLLEREFKGSQKSIANQLDEYRVTTKSAIDEGLAEIPALIPAQEAQSATKILDILKDTFEGIPGNEDILKSINNLSNKNSYTLSELNAIKRMVDGELRIFKSTGDVKSGAVSRGLFNLRDDLKTFIENQAAKEGFETVKSLNKETQVATEISKSINKRLDVTNKLPFGLRDLILGTGAFAATGNPVLASGLVISKQILESARFRTWFANKLNNLPTRQLTQLNQAAEAGNTNLLLNFLGASINEFENAQN